MRAPAGGIAATLIGVAFMGSGLITPLYVLYEKAFGFSEVTTTLVYAAYVVGNLAALLFFGKLSDDIGRRRVGAASIAVGCASMLLFLFARDTTWLFVARVLSGIAVGLASGTGTAWLADLLDDKARATALATAANAFGFAAGPLAAGFLAQYTGSPLHFPFYVYLPLVVAAGMLLPLAPETVNPRRRITLEALRPRVGVPKEIRGEFLAPAITAFGVFALVGFYAALIPTVLRTSLHIVQPAIGGLVVFELAFLAGIASLVMQKADNRSVMLAALVLLIPAIALLLLAQSDHSMVMLLVASAIAAVCWGFGIRGSLQVVNEIAPKNQRAAVASSYYIAGFVGNSIPVVGVGLLSSAANSDLATLTFGCTIAAFAIFAIGSAVRPASFRRDSRCA